jgi:hypothetical protein
VDRGRVVPEFDDTSIRELFVRSYRLIYQVRVHTVYIIGFVHGARNLHAFWEGEGDHRLGTLANLPRGYIIR